MRIPITLVLLAAFASAQGENIDRIFKVWDANGDGELTPEELPDKEMFKRVDADADGKITREEVATFLNVAAPKPEKKGAPGKKDDEPRSDARPVPAPRTVKERVEDFFRRFDANKDGRIQRKEFTAGTDEVFVKYDRGRNGEWSRREVTRYVRDWLREAKKRPNRDNFFDLFDMNRDKKVTKREYDGPGEFFRRYDHDKDRVVTEGELNRGPDAGRMMEGDEEFMADGPTRMPSAGLLERYDADEDGRITLEELNNAESVLKRLDKNGDGVLSGSEVR